MFIIIFQGYGLTESSPVNFVEDTGKNFASIGRNVASCEARLVDVDTKQDVTVPGQTGELWVRGPHVMKGYLNNDTATKETLTHDKWLKTGDIAYFDENSDFYITDRLKELIKVKGFQVKIYYRKNFFFGKWFSICPKYMEIRKADFFLNQLPNYSFLLFIIIIKFIY